MKSLIFLLIFTVTAYAGSADAIIKGASASGRTTIEGLSQDIYGPVTGFKVTIDGESITFDAQGQFSAVVNDKLKVLVFTGEGINYTWFQLIADPKTVVIEQNGPHSTRYTFDAILTCSDPRDEPTSDSARAGIHLKCTIDYSI